MRSAAATLVKAASAALTLVVLASITFGMLAVLDLVYVIDPGCRQPRAMQFKLLVEERLDVGMPVRDVLGLFDGIRQDYPARVTSGGVTAGRLTTSYDPAEHRVVAQIWQPDAAWFCQGDVVALIALDGDQRVSKVEVFVRSVGF
ncbi:MAG: hypothetical protein U0821_20770 [Chloroflexota bacterium]